MLLVVNSCVVLMKNAFYTWPKSYNCIKNEKTALKIAKILYENEYGFEFSDDDFEVIKPNFDFIDYCTGKNNSSYIVRFISKGERKGEYTVLDGESLEFNKDNCRILKCHIEGDREYIGEIYNVENQ